MINLLKQKHVHTPTILCEAAEETVAKSEARPMFHSKFQAILGYSVKTVSQNKQAHYCSCRGPGLGFDANMVDSQTMILVFSDLSTRHTCDAHTYTHT